MEDWSDEQLLAETPTTPAAFAIFYRRHEGAVLGYFMRRSGNPELAADLAAETFAAALLGARRYRSDRGEGLAWLYGIARHRLMRSIEQGQVEDRARRKLALPRLVIDDDMTERIERLAAEERAPELLERLPPHPAPAGRARVLEQRSYTDIAASVRVSEAVVRKRVSGGLLTLRSLAKARSCPRYKRSRRRSTRPRTASTERAAGALGDGSWSRPWRV